MVVERKSCCCVVVVAVGFGEGGERVGVSKKKKEVSEFFFPTARDRRGGGKGARDRRGLSATPFPRPLLLCRVCGTQERLRGTRADKRLEKEAGQVGRNECGCDEIQPPPLPPPVIEKGRRRPEVDVVRARPSLRLAPHLDSSAPQDSQERAFRGERVGERVPVARRKRRLSLWPPPAIERKKPSASALEEHSVRLGSSHGSLSVRSRGRQQSKDEERRTQRDTSVPATKKRSKSFCSTKSNPGREK